MQERPQNVRELEVLERYEPRVVPRVARRERPREAALCSQLTPLRKKSQRAFVMAARAIQPSLWAGSGPATWPPAPAPPGARPALGLPWACSKEPCRPAMPLGPGLPRALSATLGLPAPERAR